MRYFVAALAMLAGASSSAFAGTAVVPEPASMGLLAVGAGAVLLARWRRK